MITAFEDSENLQPDLNGNPFFSVGKSFGKKRLGVEGGKAAQIKIKNEQLKINKNGK